MNARETFAYHMTKALKALGSCDIGFVCQEVPRARALLIRAQAERAAVLHHEGMRECDLIQEGAPQTILQTARKVLGAGVIPFKMDCQGARAGGDHIARILEEMTKPGDSIRCPIPRGLTHSQFGAVLRQRAFMHGIRLSIIKRDMPEGILSVTCTDHAGHRERERRFAAQSA